MIEYNTSFNGRVYGDIGMFYYIHDGVIIPDVDYSDKETLSNAVLLALNFGKTKSGKSYEVYSNLSFSEVSV